MFFHIRDAPIRSVINSLSKLFRDDLSDIAFLLLKFLISTSIALVVAWGIYSFLKSFVWKQSVTFDSCLRQITVNQQTLWRKVIRYYEFEQMADIAVIDDDETYSAVVKLKNGDDIQLNTINTNFRADEINMKITIRRLREFLGFR